LNLLWKVTFDHAAVQLYILQALKAVTIFQRSLHLISYCVIINEFYYSLAYSAPVGWNNTGIIGNFCPFQLPSQFSLTCKVGHS